MLSKDDILGADDLPVGEVDVPEWGGTVYLKTLTAQEGFRVADLAPQGKPSANFLAQFAAIVICDEEGNRLFTDNDAESLGRKSHAALAKIVDAAQRHNGMGDVEGAAKNSPETTAEDSGSS